jgi:hypothetical protein
MRPLESEGKLWLCPCPDQEIAVGIGKFYL